MATRVSYDQTRDILSANGEVRHRGERGGHRRRGLANRDDMQGPAGEDLGQLAILQCARNHTCRAYRVNPGADNLLQILLESGNGQ